MDHDDDALSWEGDDDRLVARPRELAVDDLDDDETDEDERGGGIVVASGLLAGVAIIETVGWAVGAFSPLFQDQLTTGTGTLIEVVSFVLAIAARLAAIAAVPLWFGLAFWRIPAPGRRLAWFVLGAVVLLPWPVLVRLF